MDGTTGADPDRVARAIHPEINKVFRRRLSPEGREYLHLAKLDGEWKIVNALWVPKPANSG